MADLVVEAFTNEFGQLIQPGDEVVYVGTGHSVSVNKGKFAGVYYAYTRVYLKDAQGQAIREENGKIKTEIKQYVSAVRVDSVPRKTWKYDKETRTGAHVDTLSCAVLPLKRVYKIDTSLATMVGKAF